MGGNVLVRLSINDYQQKAPYVHMCIVSKDLLVFASGTRAMAGQRWIALACLRSAHPVETVSILPTYVRIFQA